MVISDLRMETEEAGLEVIRAARRQAIRSRDRSAYRLSPIRRTLGDPEGRMKGTAGIRDGEDWSGENSDSLLIKPLGTGDLLRQVEALLIRHADKQLPISAVPPPRTNHAPRPRGM
jgi:hypothetical protein